MIRLKINGWQRKIGKCKQKGQELKCQYQIGWNLKAFTKTFCNDKRHDVLRECRDKPSTSITRTKHLNQKLLELQRELGKN